MSRVALVAYLGYTQQAVLQFWSKVNILKIQHSIGHSSSLSNFSTLSARKRNISLIKSLNVVQLGYVSSHVSGAAAVDIPGSGDIPPQLSLHDEWNHLVLGTQVITILG